MWKHRGWTFYSDRGLILPGTFETQASSTPGPREARTQGSIKQLTLGASILGPGDRTHVQGARGWGRWLRREVSGRTGSESAHYPSSTPIQWQIREAPLLREQSPAAD